MNALNGIERGTGTGLPYSSDGTGKSLEDMLDANALSRMIEDFCSVTGLMVDIIDKKSGEIIIAEGIKPVCSSFHRDCPSTELSCKSVVDSQGEDHAVGLIMSHCELGLSMGFSTVTVGGEVVAEIFAGPVLLAPMTDDGIKTISNSTGIDAGTYHSLISEVSVVGPEELRKALAGLTEAVRIMAAASLEDSEKSAMAAYMALFKAKRGFLKDS